MRSIILSILVLVSSVARATPAPQHTFAPNYCEEELLKEPALRALLTANIQHVLDMGQWAANLSILFVELIKYLEHPAVNFKLFELFLREHPNLRIYLVANPVERSGPTYIVDNSFLCGNIAPSGRSLWICINGHEEAEALKKEIGITDQENLERLKDTGILVPAPLNAAILSALYDYVRNVPPVEPPVVYNPPALKAIVEKTDFTTVRAQWVTTIAQPHNSVFAETAFRFMLAAADFWVRSGSKKEDKRLAENLRYLSLVLKFENMIRDYDISEDLRIMTDALTGFDVMTGYNSTNLAPVARQIYLNELWPRIHTLEQEAARLGIPLQ